MYFINKYFKFNKQKNLAASFLFESRNKHLGWDGFSKNKKNLQNGKTKLTCKMEKNNEL